MVGIRSLSSVVDYSELIVETRILRLYKAEIAMRLRDAANRAWVSIAPGSFPPPLPELSLFGYSYPVGRLVDFRIDPTLRLSDGCFNLRETVNCPETWFNTRMRAAIQAVEMHEPSDATIYIMEQKTPLFSYFQARHPGLVGSEYLNGAVALGDCDADGIRNEDATRLTFADASFDCLLSFEVLEHVPDFRVALREARRVLRDGGRFYFTVPFIPTIHDHLIRARIEEGKVVHILEPEWHGDPVTGEGILCFQHFGWAMLDDLRASGFSSVEVLAFDQIEYGYYTEDPILVFRAVA